ncbi:MAG: type II secretion system protein, partial [Geminicoccaceae bacterium]
MEIIGGLSVAAFWFKNSPEIRFIVVFGSQDLMTAMRRCPGMHRFDKGFTLIELLVVLVILGMLSAFAAPQVLKYLGSAKT